MKRFLILAILLTTFSSFAQVEENLPVLYMKKGDHFSYTVKTENPHGMAPASITYEVTCGQPCLEDNSCERCESENFNFVDLKQGESTVWYRDDFTNYRIECKQ